MAERRLAVKCIRVGCALPADKYDAECNPVCSTECAAWLDGADHTAEANYRTAPQPVPIGSGMQPPSPFYRGYDWDELKKSI